MIIIGIIAAVLLGFLFTYLTGPGGALFLVIAKGKVMSNEEIENELEKELEEA
ncbi:hypothetical protein D3C81_1359340 [compost metagenome]